MIDLKVSFIGIEAKLSFQFRLLASYRQQNSLFQCSMHDVEFDDPVSEARPGKNDNI